MKILAITRAPQFSPNSVESDRAIMQAVADRLVGKGYSVTIISETELSMFNVQYSMFNGTILSMDACLTRWPGSVVSLAVSSTPLSPSPPVPVPRWSKSCCATTCLVLPSGATKAIG